MKHRSTNNLIDLSQRLSDARRSSRENTDVDARRAAIEHAIAALVERKDLSPALKARGLQALEKAKARL